MEHLMLYEAVLKLETVEQAQAFFADLCTHKELKDFSDRLLVASKLLEGKTYEQIAKETAVSSATIARVNRSVQYGAGGYASVLKKEEHSVK